jgi:hypothetical protein
VFQQRVITNERDTLKRPLPIASDLLEFNKSNKCYQCGEDLYQVYRYLGDRLNITSETSKLVKINYLDNKENQAEETKEQQEEDHKVKIINEFHFHGKKILNIYNQRIIPPT